MMAVKTRLLGGLAKGREGKCVIELKILVQSLSSF